MQADLKTFQELDVYGMVALTSIVTMDKETWFHDVTPIDMNVFENNLKLQYQLDLMLLKQNVRDTRHY